MVLGQRAAMAAGLSAVLLLALLQLGPGRSWSGLVAGVTVAGVGLLLTERWRRRLGRPGYGPADLVTLGRGVLVCGCAALVIGGLGQSASGQLIVLASVALALDAVDGWLARRTATASAFGARQDMETDALLVALLSLAVAGTLGWWVLIIGAARYLLALATVLWPWLAGELPPRYWAKVVAAGTGIALTVAASGLLPRLATTALLVVVIALLAESFGRQVRDLYRSAHPEPTAVGRCLGALVTAGAAAWVWSALILPFDLRDVGLPMLPLIPAEAVALLAAALLAPQRWLRPLLGGCGVLLGLVFVIELIDLAFDAVFDRPFDAVNDWVYLPPGLDVLSYDLGRPGAWLVAATVVLLAAGLVAAMPLAVLRVAAAVRRHRRPVAVLTALLMLAWLVAAGQGWRTSPRTPVAATNAVDRVRDKITEGRAAYADRERFRRDIGTDPFAGVPDRDLLRGLRGHDVLLVFAESYGRAALEQPELSQVITPVLDDATGRLERAGFTARSGFLTSPTYGAASWLAHATLQSGLWVNHQYRYNLLLTRERLTLTRAFARAGWRTVTYSPANTKPWPEGERFYGMDEVVDRAALDYAGPAFGFDSVPDQFTLAELWRRELAPAHREPVLAEIDLVSSHHPWVPVPDLLPWSDLADGSEFPGQPEGKPTQDEVFGDRGRVRAAYSESLAYSLSAVFSFIETYGTEDLVVVLVGDHQPHAYVSGPSAGHDVPISVIARDPRILRRIADWGWSPGLHPPSDAPVSSMAGFRDRFLTAFAK